MLYPSYGSAKSKNKINEVFDKFNSSAPACAKNLAGWFFLIWSSMNKGTFEYSEDFFEKSIRQIEDLAVGDDNFRDNKTEVLPVLKENFKWRGDDKEIIVKAVSIKNTIKTVGNCSLV